MGYRSRDCYRHSDSIPFCSHRVRAYWVGNAVHVMYESNSNLPSDLFDAAKPNKKCISKQKEAHMMWAHAIVGIFIDGALFGLPIWVIRNKMAAGTKAIKVMLVFCVGLFAIMTGIIRLSFIVTTDFSVNTFVTQASNFIRSCN